MNNKYRLLTIVFIGTLGLGLAGLLALGALWVTLGPAQAQTLDVPAAARAAQVEAAPVRTITVVGEGKVKAAPDTAQANIGVEVIGPEVKQASEDAAVAMQALLDALKAQGVEEKDIQTSYFNVWVERPYGGPGAAPASESLYHVSNNVNVVIRDLTKVTAVLGAALEAGANNINGVTFSVADPAELRSEARQKAVEDALATAQELAGLNGVQVGEVVSVSEVISSGAYYVSEQSVAAGLGGGGGGPISPGEVEISVQLQVSYAIQ